MMVHAVVYLETLPGWLRPFLENGRHGVGLFFVVSALTLTWSWKSRGGVETHRTANFFIRRFFRVAPMFYLGIAVSLWYFGFAPRNMAPAGITWVEVLATAAFLHGWHPTVINSVVPGGWSIAAEMTFYLVLPFMVTYLRSLPSILVGLLLSVLVIASLNAAVYQALLPRYFYEQEYLVRYFVDFWFPTELPVFFLGFLAAGLLAGPLKDRVPRLSARLGEWVPRALPWILVLAILCVPLLYLRYTAAHWVNGVLFAMLAISLHHRASRILVNPVTCFIGKVSFSAYLIHFAVLEILHRRMASILNAPDLNLAAAGLFYVTTVALTVMAASVTYFLVEQPCIRLGQRITAWNERGSIVGAGLC
jgi:peptidoglycan/LPS O-acetylase OafA/YrhL